MHIHLRVNRVGGDHTHMSLFTNGGLAGTLVMRNAEAVWFHHILWKGSETLRLKPGEFAFLSSGTFPAVPEDQIDGLAIKRSPHA